MDSNLTSAQLDNFLFDCTILGGGIAGSSAAIRLSQAGWKVLVLEKNPPGTDKICGEFLSPAAWPFLEKLGLSESIHTSGGREIEKIEMMSRKHLFRTPLPAYSAKYPFGYGISRKNLDHLLLKAAADDGASVENGVTAQRIERKESVFHILASDRKTSCPRKFISKKIIYASGRMHPLCGPRTSGAKPERIGFKAHFKSTQTSDNSLRLFFFDGAYFGILPIEGEMTNLCGIVLRNRLERSEFSFDRLLRSFREENIFFSGWLAESRRMTPWLTAAPLIHGQSSRCGKDIPHAGDAACFIEPLLGQGMTMALATGLDAADSLIYDKENFSPDNSAAIYRPRLALGRVFQSAAFSARQSGFLIQCFSLFPFAARALVETACCYPRSPAIRFGP